MKKVKKVNIVDEFFYSTMNMEHSNLLKSP
jgi:hypothetical protein